MNKSSSKAYRSKKRKHRFSFNLSVVTSVLLIILLLVGLYFYNLFARGEQILPTDAATDGLDAAKPTAVVHFIDVGQADAACIVLDSGETVLIDAGTNASEDQLLAYLARYGIRRIDYAVFSHPHEDHIGGADAVLKACDVGHVIIHDATSATSTYDILLQSIADEGCEVSLAVPGDTYSVGNASFTVLGPHFAEGAETSLNNTSIILRFQYGETSFLFMGDTEADAEAIALQAFPDAFRADVIKVGHHGSSTSSSEAFLSAVSPDVAVISCGWQNEYGHPHNVVLERLSQYTSHIFRTDECGSIRISTDGETLLVKSDRILTDN